MLRIRNKCLIMLMLCLATWPSIYAQTDTTFRLLRNIQGDIVDFTVDNLDNIYTLNSRGQMKKFNSNGDSVAVFNDVKKFGPATTIDASNPLKVLLYYQDFATIVMLDNVLNVRHTIDLRKHNIFQVKAIGQSYDNKIWLYDEVENKLKKIDEEGKLLFETPDFRLLVGAAPSPQIIFDQNQFVYLYDSLQGIFVFDYYGTLKNKILIYKWQNLKVAGKYIFGVAGGTLYRYEISSYRFDEWKLPEPLRQTTFFDFSSTRLYALRNNAIDIYLFR